MYKSLFTSILLLLISTINCDYAAGQFFQADQNPPHLKWRKITSPNFDIIYPTEMESEAQRMVNTVNSIIEKVSLSYHKQPRKISIILQNQGTTSNGFVQLAPRRSEFFTTPGQEFDYQDWLNSLAVHELRHVVQFDKLTGKLKAPFFEELGLAIFGITLPPWFYEGDAVVTETALTNAGRGRQPEFDLILRTNTLSGKKYSYSKDYLGSAKDFPPGYYQLGYYMVAKLRRDNGPGILDSLLTRISRLPFRPYSLSNSMKKYAGISTRKLHDFTINELEEKWNRQLKEVAPTRENIYTKRKDDEPINYLMPAAISANEILALKQGKSFAPVLVKIDSLGNESQILKIGQQEEFYFRYAAGNIVWDEYRSDLRYQQRSYNVVNIYNLQTKKYKQLTHHSRLFSPSLSANGKFIAAIEVSYSNKISLVILDSETGKEFQRFTSPNNYMLQTPAFSVDGKKIICVAVSKEGKTLEEITLSIGQFKPLLSFQQQLISKPVYAGNDVVFKAHYNGIDNLYRLDRTSGRISQLTSVKFGAYNPFYDISSQKIVYNTYQVTGHDIAVISTNSSVSRPTSSAAINYFEPIIAQEPSKNVFDKIPTLNYTSERYTEFDNLFYFHSLSPIAEENQYFNDYNFGLKLRSDNKLNTLRSYIGYQFNNALKASEYLAGLTYSRFYPVLSLSYLNQARLNYQRKSATDNTLIPIQWRENRLEANVTVPFSFNRLNYSCYAALEGGTSYTNRYDIINRPANFISSLSFPLNYGLRFSRNESRSPRNIAPRWGQNFSVAYHHFPFENQLNGDLFTFRSVFYFPGLLINHSLQASFNYQSSSGSYKSTIDIPRVSGYSHLAASPSLSNTLLTNYRFPLFYPDWEIGPLAYIKRFTGGFFADFENVGKANFAPRTYGAELKADMNLLRFYLPNFIPGVKLILVNEKPRQRPIFEAGLTYNY